jgi:hypothetical protein
MTIVYINDGGIFGDKIINKIVTVRTNYEPVFEII